jgi:hypothetical protein
MEARRDRDMKQVSENQSDLGDKTTGAEGGNIPEGSRGVQGQSNTGKQQEMNQEGNQQSGLGGGPEPGQQEIEGDRGAKQPPGGHGDKSKRRGGPTL